jgi:hypothetical protein
MLGAAIVRSASGAAQRVVGGDVDHPSPSALFQFRHYATDNVERRRQVHRQRVIPCFNRQILDIRIGARDRIVHDDVDPAEALPRLCHHVIDLIRHGQISTVILHRRAARTQHAHLLFDVLRGRQTIQHDRAALRRQLLRDRETDPVDRSGDQGGLVRQHRLLPPRLPRGAARYVRSNHSSDLPTRNQMTNFHEVDRCGRWS